MIYQLVIQFPEIKFSNLDQLIELEDELVQKLGDLGDFDGHDIGFGEVNFFVLTIQPCKAFEKIKSIQRGDLHSSMVVAYRELSGEEFTILYPPGLDKFKVA